MLFRSDHTDVAQKATVEVIRGDNVQWWFADKSGRALAQLDDNELVHLSEFGRRRRREARHGGSDEWRC